MPPILPGRPAPTNPADPYALLSVIPESNTKPYNPFDYLTLLADADSIFEIGSNWAQEIRTCFARFDGMPCAVLMGDPRHNAGAIGAKACEKLCRMIGIASTFHLPVVNFVDCPGFAVGTKAEKEGTIRAGAKLTVAAFESRVPWWVFAWTGTQANRHLYLTSFFATGFV